MFIFRTPLRLWAGPLPIISGVEEGEVEKTKGKSSGSCPEEVGSTPASTVLGKRKGERGKTKMD